MFSCKKEGAVSGTDPVDSGQSLAAATANTTIAKSSVNVRDQGAKGDGVTDDTKAIQNAISFAKAHGLSNVYFPDGNYLIGQLGNKSGIIKLANGIGLQGNGAATCHINLTGKRYNPNPIFYQDYVVEPTICNLVIQGIDFNGESQNQQFDASYQFGHALSINHGRNIEVKNCKFENFRGDGLLFGDTFEASLNARIVYNVNVHDNEFVNIYREGVLFCCVNGASFYNNNVHGNGYLVGGVDIERHSANESVLNIAVYNNTFNFNDGYGPVERGGPVVRYRRAITMGYFYAGYPKGIVDSLSGHHRIYNNKVYQGQIDCFGLVNISITGNAITNKYENISGVSHVSAPAIDISDASPTTGLINVLVNSNNISSGMGNGIAFKNYSRITAKSNIISGTLTDGINLLGAGGLFDSNIITDAGTTVKNGSGIVINGNASGLIISNNAASNTKTGASRTMDYTIKIASSNNGAVPPRISGNQGKNMLKGVISTYYYQPGYVQLANNVAN
ncbi:glycosyl hydrolase family 28-related protein [Mucilaginibacter sp. SP1R1]|uniref:glycosyl hydrolase family 28-related protein n=1 Tax=Mucilaginibacter sp. SP1R1 TaxID=2723091 RepID=UPI00160AEE91|nr:glycosyl hydrolase family 28-related protein [Mucilaginibacter sp. SP1R1]MBB6148299.1 hypothetical protein [Mucilaginibacter sp. SP1R1]